MAKLYLRGGVYYCKFKQNGKRVRKALSSDKRKAQIILGEMLKARDGKQHGHNLDVLLSDFLKKHEDWCVGKKKKKQTLQATARAFKRLQAFKRTSFLHEVTPALLDMAYAEWARDGAGLYVRNRDLRAIKTAMHRAELWGMSIEQKWDMVKEEKEPKGRLHYFTPDEVKTLLQTAKGHYATATRLCFSAGLRPNEAQAVRWEDIDFKIGKYGRLHVAPYKMPDGEYIPKDFERRFIPMTRGLRDHLKKLPRNGPYVLYRDCGKRPTVAGLCSGYRELVREAGFTKGSLYSLRHGFGTEAVKKVDIYKVSKLMGHSTVAMTEVYCHVAPSDLDKTADDLPDV